MRLFSSLGRHHAVSRPRIGVLTLDFSAVADDITLCCGHGWAFSPETFQLSRTTPRCVAAAGVHPHQRLFSCQGRHYTVSRPRSYLRHFSCRRRHHAVLRPRVNVLTRDILAVTNDTMLCRGRGLASLLETFQLSQTTPRCVAAADGRPHPRLFSCLKRHHAGSRPRVGILT